MSRLTATLVVIAAMGFAGCGDDEGDVAAVKPASVHSSLAPDAIGDELKLFENTAPETVAAFANAGDGSLVSDGRLWEIRRADRLIGALQLTTVLPDVELLDEEVRSTIVGQILPGSANRIRIEDEEVYVSIVNDKAVFVWFARQMYVVLQVKDKQLDGAYDELAAEVIDHQLASDEWEPLPIVLESDED